MEVILLRTPQGQALHDAVVVTMAEQLMKQGHRVVADVNGYPRPPEVLGHIPDIIANGRANLISEVETSDSYSSQHTRDQLQAFDSVPNYMLEVVVPVSVHQAARNLILYVWRISVDSWQTYPG
jgi:hypothetical protein